MNSQHSTILRSPLTVLGGFAGLSEVSMAYVLIKLSPELQSTFVWFVMLFPVVLVIGFFFILFVRPAVWFSPQDYDDPKHYLDSIAGTNTNSKIKAQVSQLEETVNGLQEGLEKLANRTPDGKEIGDWIAKRRERLQTLGSLRGNSLYTFLIDELVLEEQEVLELLRSSENALDLPTRLERRLGDSWKAERLKSVVENFPQTQSDFEKLASILKDGG
ncbi:hypothetical protein [Pelagibius sp.]|uniref:hypothetical protein n=1 Tax=Pelagibius sp. TaxID=1931238 RepID=UPI0026087775|nr:hypothetical protein [Pelagibius sp.]